MEDFLLTHGLWSLGLVILVDEMGIPFFPNAIILFTLATISPLMPEIPLWKYFLVIVLAGFTGQCLLFFGGQHGLRRWIKKHHIRLMPSEERLTKLKQFFNKKHGVLTIIGSSCITNIRPYFALIAGSAEINPWKFLPFSFLGILLEATAVTLAGYFIGQSLLDFFYEDKTLVISLFIVIIMACYIEGRLLWKYFIKNKP